MGKEVRQVLGGHGVEGLVSEEEEFVRDAEFHREPMKVNESGGDMLPGLGMGENPGR